MFCNMTLKCSHLTNVSRCSQTSLLGFRGEWSAASLHPQLLPPALASIQVDGTSFSVKAERMLNVYSAKMKGHAGLQPWSINTRSWKKMSSLQKHSAPSCSASDWGTERRQTFSGLLTVVMCDWFRWQLWGDDLKCHKNIRPRWTLQGKLHRSRNYLQFTSTWGVEADSHRRIYQLEINNVRILVNFWVLSPI